MAQYTDPNIDFNKATPAEIRRYLNEQGDTANLSEDEISKRLQGLNSLKHTGEDIGKSQADNAVNMFFDQNGVTDGQFGKAGDSKARDYISNFIQQNRRLPQPGEFEDWGKQNGVRTITPQLTNLLNDQNNKNYVAFQLGGQPQTYADEIGGLTQLQSSLVDKRNRQSSLDSTINNLPGELAQGTDQLVSGLQDAGAQTLQDELNPQIQQDLNARGLLFGGDLQAELTSAGAGIYGDIQATHEDLLAQDDAFFKDAAFKNELQKTSTTDADYLAGLQRERDSAITDSQNRFKSSQAGIQNKFEEDLTSRRAQAARYAAQERAARSKDASDAALAGQIGQAAGGIIGAGAGFLAGGPVGAVVGAGVGGGVGGAAGRGITTGK